MENRAHALAAGIFTILLGLAAAIAIWWLGQSDDSTTTYLLETRRNVTGLNIQAQVRYRGIRAGKVQAIEPDEKDPRVILVRIAIDSRFKITRGSTAHLVSRADNRYQPAPRGAAGHSRIDGVLPV